MKGSLVVQSPLIKLLVRAWPGSAEERMHDHLLPARGSEK